MKTLHIHLPETESTNLYAKTIASKNCITLTPKGESYVTEILEDTHMIAIHFDCFDENAFGSPFVIRNTDTRLQQLFETIFERTDIIVCIGKTVVFGYFIYWQLCKRYIYKK